ncbi:hypothetical protein T492DRAFT_890718 [Pavlovales sp. CCMP2436]|nr:hypothetical protein T492DRAFT_890718 [Pavlovales sp. CCMP2436]
MVVVEISQWTATIVENCLIELSALNMPFKYVDVANDNYVAYKYENEQMQALTTVYGILI